MAIQRVVKVVLQEAWGAVRMKVECDGEDDRWRKERECPR